MTVVFVSLMLQMSEAVGDKATIESGWNRQKFP